MIAYSRIRDENGRLTIKQVVAAPEVGMALLKVVIDPVESSISAAAMLVHKGGEVAALATNSKPSTALSWLALTDAAKAYRKPVLNMAGRFLNQSA